MLNFVYCEVESSSDLMVLITSTGKSGMLVVKDYRCLYMMRLVLVALIDLATGFVQSASMTFVDIEY